MAGRLAAAHLQRDHASIDVNVRNSKVDAERSQIAGAELIFCILAHQRGLAHFGVAEQNHFDQW
eukprot:COSAG01_NODE_15468_length_1334_cov_1.642105_2_plen_64_part_00